jgi:hypothetical protein
MLLDEDDTPLPQDQAPGEQWAEDQFDDDLMRELMERSNQQSTDRPSRPQ